MFRRLLTALILTTSTALAESPLAIDLPHPLVSTVNGQIPPGAVAGLRDVVVQIDLETSPDQMLYVARGIRKAGTRVGIHVHKYGGHTCVLSGAITDFVEGHDPQLYTAGSCYYMPPNTPMTAANLGTEDAILIDTFYYPKGEPFITIIEKGVDHAH